MSKLKQIFSVRELRNSIFFVLGMLFIYRLLSHIPVPGIDPESLQAFFQSNQLLGLINLVSGGNLDNFSLVALGVAPYITASIIVQLLVMIVPKLEELQKEGESGQQVINTWTRWLSLPLAFLQAFGFMTLLRQQAQLGITSELTTTTMILAMLAMVAGSVFLMWIGELISERKIGNGLSIMIFAGIIAGLPTTIGQFALGFDQSQIINILLFAAVGIVTIIGIVTMTEAQRNIPVTYARISKTTGGKVDSHLPLRVNMTGVIPIIFAISIILFPTTVAQFLLSAQNPAIVGAAQGIINFMQNQLYYGIIYFVMVVLFTFFYTSVVFKPEQIAENLQKQGAFVPGIRPGKPTESYLKYVVNRVQLAGAIFLGLIAILPLLVQGLITGSQNLIIGGTSILIVVSVVIEMVQQMNAQLTMRDYDSL